MTSPQTTQYVRDRLLNIRMNSGRLLTNNEKERVHGALQALQFVVEQQSYLVPWIEQFEGIIRAHHAKTKSDPCGWRMYGRVSAPVYGSESLQRSTIPAITMIIPECQARLSPLLPAVRASATQANEAMA